MAVISELVALLGYRVDDSGARQFDSQLDRVQRRANEVATGIAQGMGAALGFGLAQLASRIGEGIGAALRSIPVAGDEMTAAIAKITASLDQTPIAGQEAVAIYEKLHEVQMRTGISANASAQAFTQIQLAMKDLGRPASDTIELLEGIQSAALVSGAKTEDVTEVIRQLGQALGKGKLNGDELVSMSERMPKVVRGMAASMGMDMAEFFEAAGKGLLTPEKIVGALMELSGEAVKELARMPTTMEFGMRRMTNSALRFAAELDKVLGISRNLGRLFVYIADTLEHWRGGLSVIDRLIEDLGGLEAVARLAGSALLVMFGGQLLSAAATFMGSLGAILALVRRLALAFAAVALWALIIEDFFVWVTGGESKFGDRLGSFADFIKPAQEAFEAFKTDFMNIPNALAPTFAWLTEITGVTGEDIKNAFVSSIETAKEAWAAFVADARGIPDALVGPLGIVRDAITALVADMVAAKEPLAAGFQIAKAAIVAFITDASNIPGELARIWDSVTNKVNLTIATMSMSWRRLVDDIKSIFNGLTTFFDTLMQAITGTMGRFFNWVGEKLSWISSFIPGLSNAANVATSTPNNGGNGMTFPGMSDFFQGALTTPDVAGRVAPGGNSVNAPVSADIDVYITAPAGDAASIGAAARQGVQSGIRDSGTRLGDTLARGLGLSGPRVEAPASP